MIKFLRDMFVVALDLMLWVVAIALWPLTIAYVLAGNAETPFRVSSFNVWRWMACFFVLMLVTGSIQL